MSIWNPDSIANSTYEIIDANAPNRILGGLELAPNKKIYLATPTPFSTLSVINYPDSAKSGCGFAYDQIALTAPGTIGLPIHIPRPKKSKIVNDSIDVSLNNSCNATTVPNIVTPNNDGINDEFKITCNGVFEFPEDLIIYNRWGQEVYNAKKKDSLNKLTDGTYYYLFSFRDILYKGFVTILH